MLHASHQEIHLAKCVCQSSSNVLDERRTPVAKYTQCMHKRKSVGVQHI